MKLGARYIVIEMARRMAKINGSVNSKKGDLAKAAGFDQIRLSEAAIVIDYSIENDLRDQVIRVLCKRSARDIVEVGRRLNESKSMLKHGQWLHGSNASSDGQNEQAVERSERGEGGINDTICLGCSGTKSLLPRLRVPRSGQ